MRFGGQYSKERTMQQFVYTSLFFSVLIPAGVLPTSAQENGNAPAEKMLDETAPRWHVDRFAGNSTAGPVLLQGPVREVGGITRCAVAPAPDGSVFLATGRKWAHDRIVRVTPDGQLRLIAGGGSSLADGPACRAKILVDTRGNSLVYSRSDKSLYFVHTVIPAVRRLYQRDGGWFVDTVAGDPNQTGDVDGPANSALFTEPMSIVVTSTGTIYVLDDQRILRKIEDGNVTTLVRFAGGPTPVDGPLENASMAITDMSGHITLGENDDTLYVADHWHFIVRKIDLKSGTVTTIAGVPREHARFNKHADGSALTQASFVSGCAYVQWDPVHWALWCGGPDEHRFRWLKDGKMTTVIGQRGNRKWPLNDLGVPAADVQLVWSNVAAVDADGGVYLVAASNWGAWRAFMQKEGQR